MKPREQALDFPTATVAAHHAAILGCLPATCGVVRSNQLHAEALTNLCIQRIAVVSTVADQALGSLRKETALERGFGRAWFHEAKRWPRARREEDHGRTHA